MTDKKRTLIHEADPELFRLENLVRLLGAAWQTAAAKLQNSTSGWQSDGSYFSFTDFPCIDSYWHVVCTQTPEGIQLHIGDMVYLLVSRKDPKPEEDPIQIYFLSDQEPVVYDFYPISDIVVVIVALYATIKTLV